MPMTLFYIFASDCPHRTAGFFIWKNGIYWIWLFFHGFHMVPWFLWGDGGSNPHEHWHQTRCFSPCLLGCSRWGRTKHIWSVLPLNAPCLLFGVFILKPVILWNMEHNGWQEGKFRTLPGDFLPRDAVERLPNWLLFQSWHFPFVPGWWSLTIFSFQGGWRQSKNQQCTRSLGPAGAVPFQLDVHGGSLQISPLLAFGGGPLSFTVLYCDTCYNPVSRYDHGAKMCERQLFAGTYRENQVILKVLFKLGNAPKF